MTGQFFPLTATPRLRFARLATPVLTLGLAAALVACNSDTTPTASEQTAATPSASTSSDASASPSATPSDDAAGTAVGLYFVGDAAAGPRLFREFQQVEGDALSAAADIVDGGDVRDPDYRTMWPGETVAGAALKDGSIEVALNGDAFTEAPDGMSKDDATLAVQQMVHTLQGVAGERLPVQFVRTTGPQTLFGVDVSKPVERGEWDEVLSLVNVTMPEQGASVSGDTLTASGVASAFEATVQWRITQGSKTVLKGFATAEGWMDKLYPWETAIDVSTLAPGDYTFIAADSEGQAGEEEGFGPTEDSKDFTRK